MKLIELRKIFTIRILMAIGLMLMMAGCGRGGSGGSDGSGSTSIVSDSTGTDTGAGTGTLTWDAPSTNANGTVLTDLAGYKIYYGKKSGNYTEVEDVENVTTVSSDELPDIQSGIWYFAVTAYDTSGNESDYSNEVNTEIM